MTVHYCDICKQEILKWHSWHSTGYSLTHMACEVGRRPPDAPRAVYRDGDSVWFESDAKERASRKRFIAKAIV